MPAALGGDRSGRTAGQGLSRESRRNSGAISPARPPAGRRPGSSSSDGGPGPRADPGRRLSRRMGGGDKPLRVLAGPHPARTRCRTVRAAMPGGLALSANGDPERFRDVFSGPVLPDTVPGHPGPLAGILAGLEAASARPGVTHLVSVPGDAPFLPHDYVARLVSTAATEGRPIALAASAERRHFTSALWPVGLRDDLRDWLARASGASGLHRTARGGRLPPGRSSPSIPSSTSTRRRIWPPPSAAGTGLMMASVKRRATGFGCCAEAPSFIFK